eukprot:984709-Amphidinium_carterae.4
MAINLISPWRMSSFQCFGLVWEKEVVRQLQQPTNGAMVYLKRLARYLKGCVDLKVTAPNGYSDSAVSVFIDSDHVGCKDSSKSTTGFLMQWSGCTLMAASRTHMVPSWSAGDAEPYAITAMRLCMHSFFRLRKGGCLCKA